MEPGASVTFFNWPSLPEGCLTSAVAATVPPSTGSLVGVANEACFGSCAVVAATYAAQPMARATSRVIAPVFKEAFGQRQSGIQIFNTLAEATTLTVQFKVDDGPEYLCSGLDLPGGGSLVLWDMSSHSGCRGRWGANGPPTDNTVSGVTVTASSPTAKIVAIANEMSLDGALDDASYEPVNR